MTTSPIASHSPQPRLAAFPKAFMQALCKDGSMQVSEWITLAAPLGVDCRVLSGQRRTELSIDEGVRLAGEGKQGLHARNQSSITRPGIRS